MSPAEQRVAELVEKWLTSLELHLKYANLTDEAYWQVQPWARHQRPARWILELANTRAHELQRQVQARAAAGDASFAEALELMAFLANLVGVQNIERFIPLAERERENPEALGLTQSTLQPLTSTATLTQPLTSTATLVQPLSTTITQARPLLEPTREWQRPSFEAASALMATVQVAAAAPDGDAAAMQDAAPHPVADHTVQMPAPASAPPPASPAPTAAATASAPATPAIPILSGAPVLTRAALEARMARPAPPTSRAVPPVATGVQPAPPAQPAAPVQKPAPVALPPESATAAPRAKPATAAPKAAAARPAVSPAPPARPAGGGTRTKPASPPAPGRPTSRRDAKPGAGRGPQGKAGKTAAPSSVDEQVIADAVRLLKWGREWHELAEAIARMADRPGVAEVRKLLRVHKATIESQAAD
ncbi:MAG: hypothetical protein ACK53C_05115 [Pseudomonadota bacterium]